MRKALVFSLTVLLALMVMTAVALADDPPDAKPHTFIETDGQNGIVDYDYLAPNRTRPDTGYGGMGSSHWSYQDFADGTNPGGTYTYKTEGSYAGFDSSDLYTSSPHGDYGSTSNKCKVCHAVHRAEGAFKLMRSDTADDACVYCHIGDHRHTRLQAYSGNGGDMYGANGHTIGAGKDIPDSSVNQWVETVDLSGGDPGENGGVAYSDSVNVRRYDTRRNKMYVWSFERATHHAQEQRWGPTLLTCMSCHQPHNASELIWTPEGAGHDAGYKLLRGSPSGSIKDEGMMIAGATGSGAWSGHSAEIEDDIDGGDSVVTIAKPAHHGGGVADETLEFLYAEVLVGKRFNPNDDPQPQAAELHKVVKVIEGGSGISAATADPNYEIGSGLPSGEAELVLAEPIAGALAPAYYGRPHEKNSSIVEFNQRIQVANAAFTAATTGWDSNYDPADTPAISGRSPQGYIRSIFTAVNADGTNINASWLSGWCADCHNLDIGWNNALSSNFRGGGEGQSHGDRTHSTGSQRLQCYSCHRADQPSVAINEFEFNQTYIADLSQGAQVVSGTYCMKCHYRPQDYAQIKGVSDFPHAGNGSGTKLLKDRLGATDMSGTPLEIDGGGVAAYDGSTEHIDAICIDCHMFIGTKK